MITQAELKSLVKYDPLTGVFTNNMSAPGKVLVGTKIGYYNAKGYLRISLNNVDYPAQRLSWLYMTGEYPDKEYLNVDHIDTDRSNYAWSNLRISDYSQNGFNQSKRSDNSSGYKGVSWKKSHGTWYARIQLYGKSKSLGYFDTPEEAHEAYKAAAVKYHGEFANFG